MVQGFRGVGDEVTLELPPGPELTLVVGRNGSGKSSFAEALEVLLTGDSMRWTAKKAKVWKEGWRNLHHPHPALVEAEFLVEGEEVTRVSRQWAAGAGLESASAQVLAKGKPKSDLDSVGWSPAIDRHRAFLSYNELGSMFDEGPSKLYDALALVLGLEDFVIAAKLLAEARLRRAKAADAVSAELQSLLPRLQQLRDDEGDDRARACLTALSGQTWSARHGRGARPATRGRYAGRDLGDPAASSRAGGRPRNRPRASYENSGRRSRRCESGRDRCESGA